MKRSPTQLRLLVALAGAIVVVAVPVAQDGPAGYLTARLDAVRTKHKVPALAAALVVDGRTVASAVSGIRKVGSQTRVAIDDKFHLGSCAKPMTGFLAAVLIEKGIMRWDMTLKEVFPELTPAMLPVYRNITVAHLMAHQSGMRVQPSVADQEAGTLTARRYEYVKAAVKDQPHPDGVPGQKGPYSGGSIIVAAMAERLTKQPYETLMKTYVFGPIGMSHTGFGPMSALNSVTGPWEHKMSGGMLQPVTPPSDYAQEPRAPAGRNIHASIGDFARFAAANLTYAQYRPKVLSQQSLTQLHLRQTPSDFAPGWKKVDSPLGGKSAALWHNGTNGSNYAQAHVSPFENVALVSMTNAGDERDANDKLVDNRGPEASNEVTGELIALYRHLTSAAEFPRAVSRGKTAVASNVYQNNVAQYGPAAAVDGNFLTRWATGNVATATLEVDLGGPVSIGGAVITEEYDRVQKFEIQYKDGDTWKTLTAGTTIGANRKVTFPHVAARYVRLNILQSTSGPTISEFWVLSLFGPMKTN